MKKSFIVCAFILSFHDILAQNIIQGILRDQDNTPLIGATIFLPEINKGTVTDNNGFYKLSGLPSGKLKIQFSYVGYANRIETLILENVEIELNVTLETTTIKADEIMKNSTSGDSNA